MLSQGKPRPPKTYFTETQQIELPTTVSTSERKKTFELDLKQQPQPHTVAQKWVDKFQNFSSGINSCLFTFSSQPKVENQIENSNHVTNSAEKKAVQEKNRSVDVYHETVRQRATRNKTETVKDVFVEDVTAAPEASPIVASRKKVTSFAKSSLKRASKKESIEDLPCSVKELRSKFESEKSTESKILNVNHSSPKKSVVSHKIDFKKGFNVMSSLTRRSALSVSKSMQNLR